VPAEDVPAEDLRALVSDLTAGVRPLDARETADQADILAWVASGRPLFRTQPPDVPPKHLVSYFVPVDEAGTSVLLGGHRKAGLWLPPGGHVEDGEDPRQTVLREAREELDIQATFHPLAGERPFFLTVTPTNEVSGHLDVSLWFLIAVGQGDELHPDPREYTQVRWFGLAEQRDWPGDTYDPEMSRFAAKLAEENRARGGYPPR
jgi:8-oxo-dGTP pyrophosphatase MutT (NUDIX family)